MLYSYQSHGKLEFLSSWLSLLDSVSKEWKVKRQKWEICFAEENFFCLYFVRSQKLPMAGVFSSASQNFKIDKRRETD